MLRVFAGFDGWGGLGRPKDRRDRRLGGSGRFPRFHGLHRAGGFLIIGPEFVVMRSQFTQPHRVDRSTVSHVLTGGEHDVIENHPVRGELAK